MEIGILGGGLAGLSLGYFLNQRGYDFVILEKEKETGGLCRSLYISGYTFDYGGSHIIFSKDKEILGFMVSLLGENKVRNRRNTKILYKGRFVKYPFENGLGDLPKEDVFECLYFFIDNLIKREKGLIEKPKNFLEWCYYTFGKGIAEKYLIPYNKKIWKYPLEKISLEWVERVPNPPIEDVIKSALGIETEGYLHQLYFYYPRTGGIQSLIRSLESPIKDKVITDFSISRIRKINNKRWIIESNNGVKVEVDKIISTIPIFDLANAYQEVPSSVRESIYNLKYNSIITVMIGLDIDKINDFSWLYIPQDDVLPHRVSFPSNYSDMTAPRGKSSVMAEITTHEGSKIWRLNDDKLIKRTVDDLTRVGIFDKEYFEFGVVRRMKYAYVINDLNYRKNSEIFRGYFEKEGIGLVGRFSEFKYLNMDATIKSALDFVKKNFP